MSLWNEISEKYKTESVRFCTLKPGAADYLCGRITPGFIFTTSRVGWDMKANGRKISYINELGEWVPSAYIKVIDGLNPN
jgi:hypothetical protein